MLRLALNPIHHQRKHLLGILQKGRMIIDGQGAALLRAPLLHIGIEDAFDLGRAGEKTIRGILNLLIRIGDERTADLPIHELHVLFDAIGQIEEDVAGDIRIAHGAVSNQIEKHVREFRNLVVLRV